MDFQTAVRTCFDKYATFNGRAACPEFWWFWLFILGVLENPSCDVLTSLRGTIQIRL